MKDKLQKLLNDAVESITKTQNLKDLEDIRIKYLGKKGELTSILKSMGTLSAEQRPKMGQTANEAREKIEESLNAAKNRVTAAYKEAKLAAEKIDVTMPGKKVRLGRKHPMTAVIDDIKNIFTGMGYEIAEGPDIETDYYNFEALNIPQNHPAKDEQDTFYITKDIVLRTQTSPVQVRVMEKKEPPIKIIAPGRVFRSDEIDATHSPVFHQLEGLVVDKGITFANLKSALQIFAIELFGDVNVRFRPHHFPFTEPSAEMDVSCFSCGGSGCRLCKNSGFIEMLGCGAVHPKVLRMSGIDPDIYSGFAFGMGLDRIAMQRYGITDIRLLFENDVSFLSQF